MAEITPEEVRHVAELAKLALSAEEIERVGRELNRILEHFQHLQELDTNEVAITSHAITMENVYRNDEVGPSLPVADAIANAPDSIDEFFRVPRMVEK